MFFLGLGTAASILAGCASKPTIPPRVRVDSGPGRPAFESLDDLVAGDPDPRRNEIVMIAISQLGVPYAFGGTSPERGFDCSGFVGYVYRHAADLLLPRTTFDLARVGEAIAVPRLRAGDLVFYNTLDRDFSHVGIYLNDGRFVHAPATGGVVKFESMRIGYWASRFNGARRVVA